MMGIVLQDNLFFGGANHNPSLDEDTREKKRTSP